MFRTETDLSYSYSELSASSYLPSSKSLIAPILLKELDFNKVLHKGKFPILLGQSSTTSREYAIKLFPFTKKVIHPSFLHEVLITILNHKNIISILHYELEKEAAFKDCFHKVSYIVMELSPYGNFHELMFHHRALFDDKLARTYFHQLIEGLDYLHSKGISHLDLNLKNLLLGENFILKIIDFSQAKINDQPPPIIQGTECFRAPEIAKSICENSEAADIYSAGVILFVMKCRGVLPYLEKGKYKGVKMLEIMREDFVAFWEKHCEIQNKHSSFFDQEFRELFYSMVEMSPEKRPNTKQIKKSKWYNGPIYSEEKLLELMKDHIKMREIS